MKLYNLKKTIAVSALGLAAILGTSGVASAQTNKRIQKQQQKVVNQQQKVIRQQQKLAKQEQKLQNQRFRVYRNGSWYQTDQRGADLLKQAVNAGYQQGFRAGQADRGARRASSYNSSSIYRSGNYGYQSYVDSRQYQYYFQQGFQRGYQDGYNSRNQYGNRSSNGTINILGTILQGILNIQQY
jgi:flagellar biosynthesis/type III secretory pathway protein FliH